MTSPIPPALSVTPQHMPGPPQFAPGQVWRPPDQAMTAASAAELAAAAHQASEQPAVPEPPAEGSYADQLRADTTTAVPPPGAELLRDPLDLDWDERADVIAAIDDLAPHIDRIQKAANTTGSAGVVDLDLTALFDGKPSEAIRLVAKVVRSLTVLAHDRAAFTAWTKHQSQQTLFDLYGYVQQGMNLGES